MNDVQRQAVIENILDLWLSQKQLAKIQKDWKGFWNDPVKYKNLSDIVREDILHI